MKSASRLVLAFLLGLAAGFLLPGPKFGASPVLPVSPPSEPRSDVGSAGADPKPPAALLPAQPLPTAAEQARLLTAEEGRELERVIAMRQAEIEDLRESNAYLAQQFERLSADLRYARRRLGADHWLDFKQTPLAQELPAKALSELQQVFEFVGEPLEEWQIRGLAEYLPAFEKAQQDWQERHRQALANAGFGTERYDDSDPTLRALYAEDDAMEREHEQKLLQLLIRSEFVERYLGLDPGTLH